MWNNTLESSSGFQLGFAENSPEKIAFTPRGSTKSPKKSSAPVVPPINIKVATNSNPVFQGLCTYTPHARTNELDSALQLMTLQTEWLQPTLCATKALPRLVRPRLQNASRQIVPLVQANTTRATRKIHETTLDSGKMMKTCWSMMILSRVNNACMQYTNIICIAYSYNLHLISCAALAIGWHIAHLGGIGHRGVIGDGGSPGRKRAGMRMPAWP